MDSRLVAPSSLVWQFLAAGSLLAVPTLTPLTTIFFHGSLFFLALQLIGAFDFCPYDL